MNSQEIDKTSAVKAFTAASKYAPRLGSDCMRRGAITEARIPNPIIINAHWVTNMMSCSATARWFNPITLSESS